MDKDKKILITSALPYVNNVPHLGNIIGSVLSADVFARFCRARGYETLYVCGTDEYGTATENRAREENLTPREICDKYHKIHSEIYEYFNIKFDVFGRTSTDKQREVSHDIFKALDGRGYISEHSSKRIYCDYDKMFLADRYVEGICPKCGYEDARGDQCDKCGSLLEPENLIEPKCKVCGRTPVLKETKHLHLDLDKLETQLKKWFEKQSKKGQWVNNALTTTEGWFKRGLTSRPITRDLKWGVPVPKKGFENKVFYVWFDAPIGYISITADKLNNWKYWWQEPDNTVLYQFMAKDNIPFHTVLFPASLIGTGKPWTLLHHINSTEYLNYEDTKFSKSRNIGVFGTDVKKTGIPIDLWRFYLLSIRPEKNDTAFSWTDFFGKINFEFLDNIGNLINRVLVYLTKNFNGEIADMDLNDYQTEFVNECKTRIDEITESLESIKLRDALRLILLLSKTGNKFFQDSEPWAKIKTNRDEVHSTLTVLTYLIKNIAILLSPYIPHTSQRIFDMLNFSESVDSTNLWKSVNDFSGLGKHSIGNPEILFSKLDMKEAEKWRKKFSGDYLDFSVLNVKVGKIIEVENHPNAEHLFVLKVDIGEENLRTVCAGLTKYFNNDDLLNRKILLLSNLKKADLRGVESEGMILTAEKRKKLELFELEGFEIGENLLSEVGKVNNMEIDIDDFKKVELSVKDKTLLCDEIPLKIRGKEIKTVNIVNGKVR